MKEIIRQYENEIKSSVKLHKELKDAIRTYEVRIREKDRHLRDAFETIEVFFIH